MTGPGWYHADGDAEGTKRYWNGVEWVGEPTTNPESSSVIHYAAVAEEPAVAFQERPNQAPPAVPTGTTTTALEPGWHHAPGDPDGTERYWNGSAWTGEPTTDRQSGSVIHYAAAEDGPLGMSVGADAPEEQFAAPAIASNRNFPEGLRTLAMLLALLKALPLTLSIFATVWILQNNGTRWDLGAVGTGAARFYLALNLLAAVMLATQFLGALVKKPMLIFVPALVLALSDIVQIVGVWNAAEQRNGPIAVFIAVITLAVFCQIIVAVWAGLFAFESDAQRRSAR